MFCANCGKEIEGTGKYCPYCGETIESKSSQSENNENSSGNKKKIGLKKMLLIPSLKRRIRVKSGFFLYLL